MLGELGAGVLQRRPKSLGNFTPARRADESPTRDHDQKITFLFFKKKKKKETAQSARRHCMSSEIRYPLVASCAAALEPTHNYDHDHDRWHIALDDCRFVLGGRLQAGKRRKEKKEGKAPPAAVFLVGKGWAQAESAAHQAKC